MQILIPMSGAGSRFSAAGFIDPKPFIKFFGKTMIRKLHVDHHVPLKLFDLDCEVKGFDVGKIDGAAANAEEGPISHEIDKCSRILRTAKLANIARNRPASN